MTPAEVNDAATWLAERIREAKPDFVLLAGNHIFALAPALQSAQKYLARVPLVHPNAIQYLLPKAATVLVLADETEHGRQLRETCEQLAKWPLRSLVGCTLMLNQSPAAQAERQRAVETLQPMGLHEARVAHAIQGLQSWREFPDDTAFHASGVLSLIAFLRTHYPAPINADATAITCRRSRDGAPHLAHLAHNLGRVHLGLNGGSTLYPSPSIRSETLSALQGAGIVSSARSLIKLYSGPGPVDRAYPMVHATMRFVQPWGLPAGFRMPPWARAILDACEACHQIAEADAKALACYDALSLILDTELFCSFREQVPSDTTLEASFDPSALRMYYGHSLGDRLATILDDHLDTSATPRSLFTPTLSIDGTTDPLEPVDFAELMLVKGACHDAFQRVNVDTPPVLRRRSGATFEELLASTTLDPERMPRCIDYLCDLHWTTPFNACHSDGKGAATIARTYNTTHNTARPLIVHVIDVCLRQKIPTDITSLNKTLAYLVYTAMRDGERGGSARVLRTEPYAFGQQIVVEDPELQQHQYLDRYLKEQTAGVLVQRGTHWYLAPGLDITKETQCLCITDRRLIDGYFSLLRGVYRRLRRFVRSSARSLPACARSNKPRVPLPTRLLAVFIDCLGGQYPECCLGTVGTNLLRVSSAIERKSAIGPHSRFTPAALANGMLYKLSIMGALHGVFVDIRGELAGEAPLHFGSGVAERFCWLAGDGLVLHACLAGTRNAMDTASRGEQWEWIRALGHHFRRLACKDDVSHRELPCDKEIECWIVSADLRKSKELAQIPGGSHWREYMKRVIAAWGMWYDAYLINYVGDEVIFGFDERDAALAFAAAACIHGQDICKVLGLADRTGWGVGLSKGRIIESKIGDRRQVATGARVPADPIALACSASKGHYGIKEHDGNSGSLLELSAPALFQSDVLPRFQLHQMHR